jgi:hypothetical protein
MNIAVEHNDKEHNLHEVFRSNSRSQPRGTRWAIPKGYWKLSINGTLVEVQQRYPLYKYCRENL